MESVANSVNRGIVTHEDGRQPVQLVVLKIQESKAKEERRVEQLEELLLCS